MSVSNLRIYVKLILRRAAWLYTCKKCGGEIHVGQQYWNLQATKVLGEKSDNVTNRYHTGCRPTFEGV